MKPHIFSGCRSGLFAVLLSGFFLFVLIFDLQAQDYISINSGSWTNTANWNRISGWGGWYPSTSSHGSGTAEVYHNLTITGDYTHSSSTVNIRAGGQLTVTGNFTKTGGGAMNVYGMLVIEGNATLIGPLNIFPGAQVVVRGTLNIHLSNYLNVGTSVASPPYADLVVYGNVQQIGGDVLVRRNGRVAIFGDVTSSAGGGTLFTVNDGGQVYIHGDLTYTGGGDQIINQNGQDPWGFYVNGDISNTGGGAQTTTNIGNQQDLIDTNTDFLDWLVDIPDHPLVILPITLRYVKAAVDGESVQLAWVTIMEENFHKFVIEHSADGKVFKAIGEVMGQGRDLYDVETRYSFIDHQPRNGWNYYRLKAVDYDLTFDYSAVVSAKVETAHKWSVAPNPTSGYVKYFANFSVSDDDRIFLIDQTGNVLLQVPAYQAKDGIDLTAHVSPGLYILRYVSARSEHMVRVVVR